ncbi:MAG: hypothetical protein ACOYLO_16705 [Ferruginibacter sp.]
MEIKDIKDLLVTELEATKASVIAVADTNAKAEVKKMIAKFKDNKLSEGIIQCVLEVGEALHTSFPYTATEDKNELPNDIVFGKL